MSTRKAWICLSSAVAVLVAWTIVTYAQGEEGQSPTPAAPVGDLAVTIEHVGGKAETFRDEVSMLELILNQHGHLEQVHLITRTGAEVDTHIWYNMRNVVAVKYQFLAITGKSKVMVRAVEPPKLQKPTAQQQEKTVKPLDLEDYR